MATAVVRHAGARHVAVSEPNPVRRAIAERMGATIAVDPRERDLRDVATGLGMTEGFDVALEMSGSAVALRAAISNMAHGGRIAILGIPTAEISLDVNEIVFKMLTLRGIYGREMYETWYKMTVMLQSGLDIAPAISHRFPFREHAAAFEAARSGDAGAGGLERGGVLAEREPVRDRGRDVEPGLEHHRHLVPGLVHLPAVDAAERQHLEDDLIDIQRDLRGGDPEDRDAPAVGHAGDRGAERGGVAGHLQGDVEPLRHPQPRRDVAEVALARVDRDRGPHPHRDCAADRVRLGDRDVARPGVADDRRG